MCISKAVLFKDVTQINSQGILVWYGESVLCFPQSSCVWWHTSDYTMPKAIQGYIWDLVSTNQRTKRKTSFSKQYFFNTVYFYTSMLHVCACSVCLYMHSLACMPVENREQFVELALSSHHVGHGRLTRLPDKCLYPLSCLSGSSKRNDTFKLCFVSKCTVCYPKIIQISILFTPDLQSKTSSNRKKTWSGLVLG